MPSATVHARFAQTATRLINKHGRNAELVSMESSGPAWNPTLNEVVTPIILVQTAFTSHEIDGELVRASDLRFLMDASVEPVTTMRIRDNGVDYSIVDVDPVAPGTTAIIYKVQARV